MTFFTSSFIFIWFFYFKVVWFHQDVTDFTRTGGLNDFYLRKIFETWAKSVISACVFLNNLIQEGQIIFSFSPSDRWPVSVATQRKVMAKFCFWTSQHWAWRLKEDSGWIKHLFFIFNFLMRSYSLFLYFSFYFPQNAVNVNNMYGLIYISLK